MSTWFFHCLLSLFVVGRKLVPVQCETDLWMMKEIEFQDCSGYRLQHLSVIQPVGYLLGIQQGGRYEPRGDRVPSVASIDEPDQSGRFLFLCSPETSPASSNPVQPGRRTKFRSPRLSACFQLPLFRSSLPRTGGRGRMVREEGCVFAWPGL